MLLQFEGVYKNSTVYINGKKAGGAAYGYIPFFVETDGLLNYGENNTIRVGKSGQVQVTVSGKQIDGTSTSIAIAE